MVKVRCCGHILAIVAMSLTCRGGGDWGGEGETTRDEVVVMEEC